jgi:hypothetical protein
LYKGCHCEETFTYLKVAYVPEGTEESLIFVISTGAMPIIAKWRNLFCLSFVFSPNNLLQSLFGVPRQNALVNFYDAA